MIQDQAWEKPVIADENAVSLLTVIEEGDVKFAAVYEEADARLIAAAPDLLDALQSIMQSAAFGTSAIPEHFKAPARAAIVKALGEQA